ncbi:MAG: hypothetical protein AAF602_12515 [Myxococcota bacterium]
MPGPSRPTSSRGPADGDRTPDAPPAFPSIPIGAFPAEPTSDWAPPVADVRLASTTDEVPPGAAAGMPQEVRAVAVGLGCVVILGLGASALVLAAAFAMWSGLLPS